MSELYEKKTTLVVYVARYQTQEAQKLGLQHDIHSMTWVTKTWPRAERYQRFIVDRIPVGQKRGSACTLLRRLQTLRKPMLFLCIDATYVFVVLRPVFWTDCDADAKMALFKKKLRATLKRMCYHRPAGWFEALVHDEKEAVADFSSAVYRKMELMIHRAWMHRYFPGGELIMEGVPVDEEDATCLSALFGDERAIGAMLQMLKAQIRPSGSNPFRATAGSRPDEINEITRIILRQ